MKKNEECYDCLKLENQFCFPLYAASRKIVKAYTPYLKPLNITYTQYITLMVLWEEKEMRIGDLGKKLFLDTGTLTPLLKKMEDADVAMFVCSAWIFVKIRTAKCLHDEDNLSSRKYFNVKML